MPKCPILGAASTHNTALTQRARARTAAITKLCKKTRCPSPSGRKEGRVTGSAPILPGSTENSASDTLNPEHGFLYKDGTYTTIDAPGATAFTQPTGINDAGQIIGQANLPAGGRIYRYT